MDFEINPISAGIARARKKTSKKTGEEKFGIRFLRRILIPMDRRTWRSLAFFALMLVGPAAFAGKPEYRMVLLGTPAGHSQSFGGGISSANEVIWESDVIGQGYQGFLWRNGSASTLGSLGIPPGGYRRITPGGVLYGTGYNFQNGIRTRFSNPDDDQYGAQSVSGMNDSGVAVGEIVENFSGYTKGYIFENGVPRVQNIPGAFETIYTDINASGKIVGWSSPGNGNLITYDRGKWEDLTSFIPNQHSFNTSRNAEYKINDRGVIGFSDFQIIPDGKGSYLSKWLPMRKDGRRGGFFSLNNKDQMVGTERFLPANTFKGTFFDGEANFYFDEVCSNLPTGVNVYGLDINDNGWILGAYITPDNIHHGFVMQPVPEPGTLLLLGGGIGLMARRRRKRDI